MIASDLVESHLPTSQHSCLSYAAYVTVSSLAALPQCASFLTTAFLCSCNLSEGDGAGVGKGRQIAGELQSIIISTSDQFVKGPPWLSLYLRRT